MLERIEHLIAGRPEDHPAGMNRSYVYLRLAASDQIDAPAIVYVEPDPAQPHLSSVADR